MLPQGDAEARLDKDVQVRIRPPHLPAIRHVCPHTSSPARAIYARPHEAKDVWAPDGVIADPERRVATSRRPGRERDRNSAAGPWCECAPALAGVAEVSGLGSSERDPRDRQPGRP